MQTETRSPDDSPPQAPVAPVLDVAGPDAGAAEGTTRTGDPPASPLTLAVLPLRNTIVFPGTVVPLSVNRAGSLRLLEESLPQGKMLALVMQKDPANDEPGPADLHEHGTLAKVISMMRQTQNGVVILVHGEDRIRVKNPVQTEPFLRAEVEVLPSVAPATDDNTAAAMANLRESAVKLLKLRPDASEEAVNAVNGIHDASTLTDFLASNLGLEVGEQQALLEERDVLRRIARLQGHLYNQLHIAELQSKLRQDVQSEFSEAQKRAYLREQVRAIQKELGEDGGTEEQVEDLRRRLDEAGLPDKAKAQAKKELKKLEITPAASPDHSVTLNYLETLADLPWQKLDEEHVDLKKAQEILDRDHYGLEKIKRRLIEYLAVRKLNPAGHGPILCFLGPPGVGKTSLGQSIADSLGRKFARISLGGIRDESEIRGHRRTYIGSMPGRLIQELRRLGTRNPVIMLDELDKMGADFRGDPASALLEVLDPRQNHEFVDRYVDLPFDLSQVMFIATCNTLDTVPAPLRDRMEVVQLPGYTEREKLAIGRSYLVRRQVEEHGLKPEQCPWTDEAISTVIEDYTREAGVRNLERQIASVVRHVAAQVAKEETDRVEVTPAVVVEALGAAQFGRESRLQSSAPGVVTGLAYTSVGGEILHIEAVRYPGKGGFILTGQLGDVMKESVRAALSLVRSRADKLGIDPKEFEETEVHVHVPAGAVPKDGPSAGIAMFTALASLYTGRPVSKDVAMTGEVTLRGLALPIGGLKEKSIAALRAGIKTILIPRLNEKDIPELPAEVRETVRIIPVDTVDDVLREALVSE
ncbi:endopeptidase La [Verrucomicrobium sp. BvORR106]|uniref:endopeptidase La n=1 Tax=Verrucomicrobium sp. BvORR106 TaxID=1403819 RepID=UPI00056F208C|nr:endopeptidase La [Verrucomicrobium sp. BvORR106]